MVPQRLDLSYTYTLPIGRGQHFLSAASGVVDKLVAGWGINGITTFSSGQYTTPYIGYDFPVLGAFSNALPNRVGALTPANRSYDNWWNPNAFALPGCPPPVTTTACASAIHVEGDASRNSLEEPGVNNWDLSATKDTRLTESSTLQFRAEFFNAFNHPQFGIPNNNLSSGIFGRVTSLLIPSREIQFGMKLLW
jgi:hypothetical protein